MKLVIMARVLGNVEDEWCFITMFLHVNTRLHVYMVQMGFKDLVVQMYA